jgi:chemotaxis protein CheD
MMRTFNPKFERVVYDLFAGEYYVTKDQSIMLSTLLGSCVSVCLMEREAGLVGMNHYMLPWKNDVSSQVVVWDGRYGFFAMDYIYNKMIQQGANPAKIEAKIFGGARIMEKSTSQVSDQNIRFARAYLEMQRIPVTQEHIGGIAGRRIFVFPDTFEVQVRVVEKYETKDPAAMGRPAGVETRRRT